MTFLGLAYLTGSGVPMDDMRSMMWFMRASEKGDSVACLRLGYAYLYGHGLEKDLNMAERYFHRVSDLSTKAFYYLGQIYYERKEFTKMKKVILTGARRDDANCLFCFSMWILNDLLRRSTLMRCEDLEKIYVVTITMQECIDTYLEHPETHQLRKDFEEELQKTLVEELHDMLKTFEVAHWRKQVRDFKFKVDFYLKDDVVESYCPEDSVKEVKTFLHDRE